MSFILDTLTHSNHFTPLNVFPYFCINTRVKKLRETLVAMQQLDKNMSSLRSWLAHIETELSRPIVYDSCDDKEIQRKLNQQQASGPHTEQLYSTTLPKCNVEFPIDVRTDVYDVIRYDLTLSNSEILVL